MISLTTRSPRLPRVVLVLGIVCLLATFAGVILVAAHGDDTNASAAPSVPLDTTAKSRVAEQFGKLPLSFELNKGQIDEAVKFMSHGIGYDLFLTSTGATLRVNKPQTEKSKDQTSALREGTVLRLKMLGANTNSEVEGQDELPGKVNYFISNDPEKWRRNIPTYQRVHFKNVYPGIDVVYYGKQRELEYDFVVAAGANPKLIRFTIEGADRISLDKTANLLLAVNSGEVRLNKPSIYQLTDAGRTEVKGSYVIDKNEIRFKLQRYDSAKPLVIDPVLLYSTFLSVRQVILFKSRLLTTG